MCSLMYDVVDSFYVVNPLWTGELLDLPLPTPNRPFKPRFQIYMYKYLTYIQKIRYYPPKTALELMQGKELSHYFYMSRECLLIIIPVDRKI